MTSVATVVDVLLLLLLLVILTVATSHLPRRSNSICKSPGPASPKEHQFLIGRSESLRSSNSCSHRIFRPCDLIHGEVLGKGFFGQAIKVTLAAIFTYSLP